LIPASFTSSPTKIGLATVLEPGGKYFMLCFSDHNPGEYPLPRRIAKQEIRETFRVGWSINAIKPAVFENASRPKGTTPGLRRYQGRGRVDGTGAAL